MHQSHNRYVKNNLISLLLLTAFGGGGLFIEPANAKQVPEQLSQVVKLSAKDFDAQVKKMVESGQLKSALELMQSQEPYYENDAEFFYSMGRLASQLEQHQLAANLYERAVLIKPDYVGAWLELAIANFAMGNRDTAISYFAYIQANFHPPKEVVQAIDKELQQYAIKKNLDSVWTYSIDLVSGIDTNANSGLRIDTLSLTEGDLREYYALDEKFKARTDRFNQLGASVQYGKIISDQKVSFFSSIKQKSFVDETDYSTLDAQASLAYQRNSSIGELSYWLQVQHISLGGVSTLLNSKLQAQLERPIGNCFYNVGMELERRFFLQSPTMDGRLVWLQGGLNCKASLFQTPMQISLTNRLGRDFATRDRAGGRSRDNEFTAQIVVPLSKTFKLNVGQAYAYSHDVSGYSPKLENNARRTIGRYVSRAQLNWMITPSFEVMLNFENYHVSTNIALFKQGGKVYSFNLRQAF